MKETDIRKYAGLMEELGLTGLEITENDQVVRLERSVQPAEQITQVCNAPATETQTVYESKEKTDYISVKSPIVGVFYAAPAQNADAYVKIGDAVKKGQTLCIVEAMKLMNEITAQDDGVVSEICVTNGQVVEYGTELFHIAR